MKRYLISFHVSHANGGVSFSNMITEPMGHALTSEQIRKLEARVVNGSLTGLHAVALPVSELAGE